MGEGRIRVWAPSPKGSDDRKWFANAKNLHGLYNRPTCAHPGPATQTQKGGCMIVRQNKNLRLSSDFFIKR